VNEKRDKTQWWEEQEGDGESQGGDGENEQGEREHFFFFLIVSVCNSCVFVCPF